MNMLLTGGLPTPWASMTYRSEVRTSGKSGVCIGFCLAPLLSDLLLAHFDRKLNDELRATPVTKVFRCCTKMGKLPGCGATFGIRERWRRRYDALSVHGKQTAFFNPEEKELLPSVSLLPLRGPFPSWSDQAHQTTALCSHDNTWLLQSSSQSGSRTRYHRATGTKLYTWKSVESNTHQCSYCPYNSCRRIDLEKHVRTHTGEKPYKCSCCPCAFTQRPHLKVHMRSHTGEKPFVCGLCASAFKWKHQLVKHKKQQH
ncbi:uncharacterized protein LOC144158970 isoform X2 [Haemaphysalis longicornis]